MKYSGAAAAAFLFAALFAIPAKAAVIDDFNRPNANTLGPNYTAQNGSPDILNGQVIGTFAELSTYNGSSSTTAGLDISLRGLDSGSYVALALGYSSGDPGTNYFIKVQDNNGDGFFDSYGFYDGNNIDGSLASLSGAFQAGTMDVSYAGTIATLVINANNATQTYSYDYGFAPSNLSVGLGVNRMGVADNLRFEPSNASAVPEPGTWAMLIAGFGMVGGAMRSRGRTLVAA